MRSGESRRALKRRPTLFAFWGGEAGLETVYLSGL